MITWLLTDGYTLLLITLACILIYAIDRWGG